jgi:hypothetical protein
MIASILTKNHRGALSSAQMSYSKHSNTHSTYQVSRSFINQGPGKK